MNIYDLVRHYYCQTTRIYINKNTYDALDESKYLNLPNSDKKNWILVPKFSLSHQEKWAKKFLKTLSIPYEKSVKQIENVYMKPLPILYEKNTEQIKNVYTRKSKKKFIDGFHQFCEDNKLWEKFIYFQEVEEVNTMIRWCKENNIPYDTESEEEKDVKYLLKKINANGKKLEFNEKYEHSPDYMDKFELFCKENGIWEEILKIDKEEQEKYRGGIRE